MTEHDDLPTHAFETTVAEALAWQEPVAYDPHEPLGLP
jgi:hypothetical protein